MPIRKLFTLCQFLLSQGKKKCPTALIKTAARFRPHLISSSSQPSSANMADSCMAGPYLKVDLVVEISCVVTPQIIGPYNQALWKGNHHTPNQMVIELTTWAGLVPAFRSKGFIVYNSLASVASWRVPNFLYGCSWMASGTRQMASSHTDNFPLTQTSGECPCPNLQMRKSRTMWLWLLSVAQICHKWSWGQSRQPGSSSLWWSITGGALPSRKATGYSAHYVGPFPLERHFF